MAEMAAQVEHGGALTALAEAACAGVLQADARRDGALAACRARAVAAVGEAGALDAAGVAAMFNGINVVADMCGVRIDRMTAPLAGGVLGALGVAEPANWAHQSQAAAKL